MSGFTTEQLAELEAAIASGVLEIEYNDAGGNRKKQRFQSLGQMMKLRDRMRRELELTSQDGSFVVAKFDKGL